MRPPRRAYLDWLRGVAVLCMIEWHVIGSWTVASGRQGAAWAVMTLIGGMAAPLFLFLAGVAVPLAIGGHVSRGAVPGRAAWLVQRRGWEVFGIAHLFRLQSFLFNPTATWSGVLRPDILNILGLGLAGTAWLVGRLAARGRRAWWALVPAAIVLLLTPASRHWWWPTLLPPRLEAYIRPVDNLGVFELFPWVAFVPVGAFIGLLIAQPRDESGERRLHRQFALWGVMAAAVGFGLSRISVPSITAWTSVWALFLTEAGLMTMAVWLAWVWLRQPIGVTTSGPLVLFGRTSLFVYWVHVELAFGAASYPLHHALPLGWAIVGFAVVTALMYVAAGASAPAYDDGDQFCNVL